MTDKYDYNLQLIDLDQFLHILKMSETLQPHDVVEMMIKRNQKMNGIRNYLQSIINDIDKSEENK